MGGRGRKESGRERREDRKRGGMKEGECGVKKRENR